VFQRLFFWPLFAGLMGFALGGSFVWGWNFTPAPSGHHSSRHYEVHSAEAAKPAEGQPQGTATSPFFVQVIPSPKPPEERTQEAEDREEKKDADQWLVRWTFALFAATIGLILATGVLGYFAYRQADDMKASIKAAETGADAAMLSARAAIAIELPIIRTAIGTLGFALSKVGDAEETASAWVDHLTFSNLGKSKAFPIELRLGETIGDQLPKIPRYTYTKQFLPNYIFEPDPRATPRMSIDQFTIDMSLADQGLLVSDQMQLWIYCCLVWDDFMGTRHESGFCWLWTGSAGKGAFRVDQSAAYNHKT
jgi:hypothetical protein